MGQFEQAHDKFEEYLRELEAKETAKKRKRIFYIFPPLILGVIMLFQYLFPTKPASQPREKLLQVYQASDLNTGKVREIFEVDNAEIVVEHPIFGTDTIHSADEYEEIVSFTLQAEKDKIAVNTSLSEADSIRVAAKGTLEVFLVDVAGDRMVGSPLTFTIEKYDPSVTYFLDFGNGITRKVEEKITYAYPLKGHFVMQLIARQPGKGASIYTKKYEIKEAIAEGESEDEDIDA